MENKKLAGQGELTEALPVLAAAALGNATGGDAMLKALLTELLQDTLDKRRKEKEKMHRLAESAVQAAKEEAEMKAAQQKRCNHKKQDGTTRLVGQRVSGTGQLSLVCQFCNKNWFLPAHKGQEAPPAELIPPPDEIGG